MEGKRLLHTLKLTNFLSYGPEGEEIELQPLNVLIGPNGSGKSNLIEAIGLLKAAPHDLPAPIRAGGGMPAWPWKGEEDEESSSSEGNLTPIDLAVETTVSYPNGLMPLRYRFELSSVAQRLEVVDEVIEYETKDDVRVKDGGLFYAFQHGDPIFYTRESVTSEELGGKLIRTYSRPAPGDITPHASILSQRKDPDRFPELGHLGKVLSEICLFRECNLGHNSPLRGPQKADQPAGFLLEDGRNLGIVLNELSNQPATKKLLLNKLRQFYGDVEDITTRVHAGTVETFFHECWLGEATPSLRLSDGTLRYLCLLTILCHPDPPPLVCIEDPEIGLHPDVLPYLAELMIEASRKMQLVVTTHSDVLVSALTDVPEAVVVCERDDQGSHLERLDGGRLKDWLKKYSLGDLWVTGELGGTT